jgi:dimeric dUTPase (all-alpha-NTP-PPase superfamily)
MTTQEMITEMLYLQYKFNEQVNPRWDIQDYNWDAAILAEAGELLDSTSYKWWKKTEDDIENIKVEVVDIFHFLMSKWLTKYPKSTVIKYFNEAFAGNIIGYCIIDSTLNFNKSSTKTTLSCFASMVKASGMDLPELYKRYIIKNCLNKFRQDHGYKSGTYKKDWNGKEDNIVALELYKEGMSFDTLYGYLKDYYNQHVK